MTRRALITRLALLTAGLALLTAGCLATPTPMAAPSDVTTTDGDELPDIDPGKVADTGEPSDTDESPDTTDSADPGPDPGEVDTVQPPPCDVRGACGPPEGVTCIQVPDNMKVRALAVGDVTGDGCAEMVWSDVGSDRLFVVFGAEENALFCAVELASGFDAYALHTANMFGDATDDILAVVTQGGDRFLVGFESQCGEFSEPASVEITVAEAQLPVDDDADVFIGAGHTDGDGSADLVYGSVNAAVHVAGKPDGFGDQETLSTAFDYLLGGFVLGDDAGSIVLVAQSSVHAFQRSDGFANQQTKPLGGAIDTFHVARADVSGLSELELFLVNASSEPYFVGVDVTGGLDVFTSLSTGPGDIPPLPALWDVLVAGDLGGGAETDVLLLNAQNGDVADPTEAWLYPDAVRSGEIVTFQSPVKTLALGSPTDLNPQYAGVGDIDGDGDVEVLIMSRTGMAGCVEVGGGLGIQLQACSPIGSGSGR